MLVCLGFCDSQDIEGSPLQKAGLCRNQNSDHTQYVKSKYIKVAKYFKEAVPNQDLHKLCSLRFPSIPYIRIYSLG